MTRLWITWETQRRNRSTSAALNADLLELDIKGNIYIRYLKSFFSSIKKIISQKPKLLFVQNPSIVLAIFAILIGFLTKIKIIIDAHNAGLYPLEGENKLLNIVPSLAARVKHKLEINNPYTIAYDLPFGCAGWLQGMIQADYFIKSGDAKKALIIGADILSRISDPHDRDSMLYADGAGATILEAKNSNTPIGILAHKTRSDTFFYSKMLYMGKSYNPDIKSKDNFFLKMNGRKLYQYALENVPQTIKDSLDKSNTHLNEIDKVLIHQANGKMDDAMLKRLYKLYDIADIPKNVMPMTIAWLGNSSVATIPTLLDLILKDKVKPHKIKKGNNLVFASVGAGMNINAVTYKV